MVFNNKIFFKLAAIIIFLLLINVNSFSLIVGNYLQNGYCEDGTNCSGDTTDNQVENTAPSTSNINDLVVRGGGYFLASNADIYNFLKEIEMAEINGVDYEKLDKILVSAIYNLEHSKAEYKLLVDLLLETPYNPLFIDQLLRFDYYGFMYRKNVDSNIYWDVVGYLAWGDINGFSYRLYTNSSSLLNELYRLRLYIKASKIPPINYCWAAGRGFSNAYIFGQLGAEIFYNVSRTLKYD